MALGVGPVLRKFRWPLSWQWCRAVGITTLIKSLERWVHGNHEGVVRTRYIGLRFRFKKKRLISGDQEVVDDEPSPRFIEEVK